MKKIILGIDPGYAGGISIIDYEGKLLDSRPMPIIKTFKDYKDRKNKKTGEIKRVKTYKKEMDIKIIKYVLQTCVNFDRGVSLWGDYVKVFIEDVHSMPTQGVTSTFNFGAGFGELKGFLKAMDIEYKKVSPIKWKNHFFKTGYDKGKKRATYSICMADKHAVAEYAKSIISFSFMATDRSTVPHDGMAESYLIAEYGRNMLNEHSN